jgi:hypothetical protein
VERSAIGDQARLVVAREMAPHAADDETLHHNALPCGITRADRRPRRPLTLVSSEKHRLAAERQAVDVAPDCADGGLEEEAAIKAAEAIAGVGADSEIDVVE